MSSLPNQNDQPNEPSENQAAQEGNDSSYEDQEDGESEKSEEPTEEEKNQDPKFGCKHYRRRCQLRCLECQQFFTCRLCHDDAEYYGQMDPKKNHQIDRHAVKEIRCLNCEHVQKPQANCEKCKIEFAGYFCAICNLFDDEYKKKGNFHCDGCGICRVGGRDNFFHCDNCGCCLTLNQKDNHPCVKEKLKQDCAVCMDDMHGSTNSVSFLKCGHAMHSKCYRQYVKTNIACPMCKKSIVDPKYFEQHMDTQILLTPMPAEYANTEMLVLCNDCLKQTLCKFHIFGGKCNHCRSYNTTRVDNEAEIQKFKEMEIKQIEKARAAAQKEHEQAKEDLKKAQENFDQVEKNPEGSSLGNTSQAYADAEAELANAKANYAEAEAEMAKYEPAKAEGQDGEWEDQE